MEPFDATNSAQTRKSTSSEKCSKFERLQMVFVCRNFPENYECKSIALVAFLGKSRVLVDRRSSNVMLSFLARMILPWESNSYSLSLPKGTNSTANGVKGHLMHTSMKSRDLDLTLNAKRAPSLE